MYNIPLYSFYPYYYIVVYCSIYSISAYCIYTYQSIAELSAVPDSVNGIIYTYKTCNATKYTYAITLQ